MLVIDELHNVQAGRSDKRREFLNLNAENERSVATCRFHVAGAA
jgi:hypothetical protein